MTHRRSQEERVGQIKNELNGLVIEKNLLLDEIIALENRAKKLEEKLLKKEQEEQEQQEKRVEIREKIRVNEDGELIRSKEEIRAKNIPKSVEFYS